MAVCFGPIAFMPGRCRFYAPLVASYHTRTIAVAGTWPFSANDQLIKNSGDASRPRGWLRPADTPNRRCFAFYAM